jgi:hypothetical protein
MDPWELFDVLERIKAILDRGNYEFVSLSCGPLLPVDDNDVHAWTSVLDAHLSDGRCLLSVAAGNTGAEPDDPVVMPRRIQVPSDCVNAIAVGATNKRGPGWQRARYSSIGPGRSPGVIKPDFLAFGGSEEDTFWVMAPDTTASQCIPVAGTSYAAPSALRLASGVRAQFGDILKPLTIRALLIHGTERSLLPREEIGWGRLHDNFEHLVSCPPGAVRIVYQDVISASKYRRLKIAMPNDELEGKITIRATFCFATSIDPEHPGNYTRSGLEIVFRPHMDRYTKTSSDQKTPQHPKSASFFKPNDLYPTEQKLRQDAHKWETCLHGEIRKMAKSLKRPVFDVHYNARIAGHNDSDAGNIPYALILTISSSKPQNLYDRIVRNHRAILEPIKPVIQIPLRT